MDKNQIVYLLAWVGTGCWAACFWWMHRISKRQDTLLNELQEQGKRIEELSKVEHDLIKEVHPQVGAIKAGVEEVKEAVKENLEAQTERSEGPSRAPQS